MQAAELAAELPEAELSVRLGRGDATAHIFFSDLTHDYIRINSEYTT
ncbi:MAG: bifunctional ornithine acetyltransferase/N-acetylglutamate synthase [Solirubrobacterales bacterium]